MLTKKYNAWLQERLSSGELKDLRTMAGVKEDELIPRLTKDQFNAAPDKRFHLEATFYMELERDYFEGMFLFLHETLGVRSLIVGTSDHNHYKTGYPLLTSTSKLDVVDGHVYWQHPNYRMDPRSKRRTFSIPNTPMVNDPLSSTVVQLSRSAVAGKPYTVSETNHPFPNEYACEGIGILAAYSAFHDWDGIFLYTFEHKDPGEWELRMPGHFEIRPDPVRMTNLAACAVMFLRSDLRPALVTVPRWYSMEQVREGIRLPSSERSYFTPGFPQSLPLRHATRIAGFDEPSGPYPQVDKDDPIVSDTGELTWYRSPEGKGLVTVETDKSQALIGFVRENNVVLRNLSAAVENEFCSIILTSLDTQAISSCGRLLLVATARSANSQMIWNQDRTSLTDWGAAPMVIEAVRAKVTLRNMEPATRVEILPLTGEGKEIGNPVIAQNSAEGYTFAIGDPATTWHLITIRR